jgi:Domain of unknown function (DUF4440)
MPRYPILLLLVALVAAGRLTPCQAEPPPASTPAPACLGVAREGADVEAVRQMEQRGARMNIDGWDFADSREFFASDFVSIQPGGGVSDLAAVMSTFSNGRSPGWARRFDLTELDVRIFNCEFALVIGTAEAHPLAAAADAPPWRVRFLNVWRKEGGRWRYWANQFTTIVSAPEGGTRRPGP